MQSKSLIFTFIFFLLFYQLHSQTWNSLGQGIYNNTQAFNNIQSIEVSSIYGDSITKSIFVGGLFIYVNDQLMRGIARWDSNGWHTMGLGMDVLGNNFDSTNWPGPTKAITRFKGSVFTGGFFTNASGVPAYGLARWDGLQWQQPSDCNGIIFGFLVQDTTFLYAFGTFDTITTGVNTKYIARFDGTQWVGLPPVPFSGYAVGCGAFYNGELYVGGNFWGPGGLNDIAKLDTVTGVWSNVGGGLSGPATIINAMAVFNGELYVGGYFGPWSGEAGAFIMKWNGSTWSQLGGGLDPNCQVYAMLVHRNELYIGRQCGWGPSPEEQSIAKWDGVQWKSVTTAPEFSYPSNNGITSMTELNDKLYIAGRFETLYGDSMFSVAQYNDVTGVFEPIIINTEIFLYPNPAKENININLSGNFENQSEAITVTIYDITGQLLIHQLLSSQAKEGGNTSQLNIHTLSSGTYMVEVRNEKGFTARRKLVKE